MSNEDHKLLGATVPQEWIDRFEKLAKQRGHSVTEVVRDALAKYIGIDANSAKMFSQLEQCQTEIKLLKKKITELELYKTQIKDLSIRLSCVEQNIGKIQTQSINTNSKASSETWLIKDTIDEDDFDDEPDEILTDFLPPTVED